MLELTPRFAEGDLIADQYRILGVAGSGGMGVVYRAQDIHLHRMVAIKVLPSAQNPRDEERFLREARTACSLDQQNIGVIYEVGTTSSGTHFIAMAFYEGASLAERLNRGPLAPEVALDLVIQAAEGLREAHQHGIVHRDIKPSNLMVTSSDILKIVDFGLAQPASAATATLTGTTGTVAYMSPEQALGRNVDQRTDLWSLGVTFVEMLTGRNPFARDTIPAIMLAILNDSPEGIDTIPVALQPILYRCLAKDPNERYSSAHELLVDLKDARERLASGTPVTTEVRTHSISSRPDSRRVREMASRSALAPAPTSKRYTRPAVISIIVAVVAASVFIWYMQHRKAQMKSADSTQQHVAVLPFENIGSNPENETLAAGLMDSLTGRLSDLKVGNQSLWVVPNSEVRRLKVTDPKDALEKLNANLVVKGSIEREGQQVQLHVNLIDTKNLRQVGSVEVADEAGDLSTLENKTVAQLAELLHIPVTADMLRTTGGSVNPAAYENYLTALGYMQRYDKPGNLDLAIAALNKSIATDPQFAVGFAALGEAYWLQYRTSKQANSLTEAEANASKAVELNSQLSEPYVTLGKIHDSAGKHDLALQEFQHALQVDPRDPKALAGLARAYDTAGRTNDAAATYQKAIDLGPNDWNSFNNFAVFLHRHHQMPAAIANYKHALELAPDNSAVLLNLGSAYIDAGDPASLKLAEETLQRSIAIHPSYPAYANLGQAYYRERKFADAAEATRKALAIDPSDYRVWDNLRDAQEWLNDSEGVKATAAHISRLLEAQIPIHPQDALAQATYANISARYGSKEDATVHLRSALAISPDDPNILETAACTEEALGNRSQAIAYLKRALAKGLPPQDARSDPEVQPLLAAAGVSKAGP